MKTQAVALVLAFVAAFSCVRCANNYASGSMLPPPYCEQFPDGSCKGDGPVFAQDLIGIWCEPADPNGRALCLSVDAEQRYTWANFNCHEKGRLSGALEFTPETLSVCWGFTSLYSASVDFTDTGINVFLDKVDGGYQKVSLEFRE